MARPSKRGGKPSAAKARKASSVSGRKKLIRGKKRRTSCTSSTLISNVHSELQEARQQQAATTEILEVIARSPKDVQPVFDAIAARANKLMGGYATTVLRIDGDIIDLAAFTPVSKRADAAIRAIFPMRITGHPIFELTQRGEVTEINDTESEIYANLPIRSLARARGFRSRVLVPLKSDSGVLGAISVTRIEPGAFDRQHVELLKTFAAQAVIAIENARLFEEVQTKTRDLSEALTYQTGSANILKVIASSPTDIGPVLKAIVESACELCGAYDSIALLKEGDHLRFSAHHGPIPLNVEKWPINRKWVSGRAFVDQKPVHVTDLMAEGEEFPDGRELSVRMGHRTMVAVPLLRKGESIGAIILRRNEVNPFTHKQVALLQTFADQAVIAIENVRLFNEAQLQKREAMEALEYQTATGSILEVISRSPSDAQPVFDAIVKSAALLCDAAFGVIWRYDGDMLHYAASHNFTSAVHQRLLQSFPRKPDRSLAAGRAILDSAVTEVPNMLADPAYAHDLALAGNWHASVAVPMLHNGMTIGAISLGKSEPGRFSERQIQLISTFADQAVIAIENTRLFNETKEALERQTATADVLNVIGRSPTNAGPVFGVIGERAERLCDAEISVISILDGDLIRLAGIRGINKQGVELFRAQFPLGLHRQTVTSRTIKSGAVVHIADVLADATYDNKTLAAQTGYRSCLGVPMHNKGQVVGAIFVARTDPGPFSENQIQLLQIFADQAVIAIQNVRLFDEVQAKSRDLSEALTYQIGSANILRVIAASPTNVEPALRAIVESACQLCEAYDATVVLQDGDDLRFSAHHGPIPIGLEKWPISRRWTAGRAFLDQTAVQISDALSREGDEFSDAQELARGQGHRTILSVPLLREGKSLGAITLRRLEVSEFTGKQISLLQTFADQAVIAISNVRLFDEVQARTRDLAEALQQQTATADVLQIISSSPGQLEPVFQMMLTGAMKLCEASHGVIWLREGEGFRSAALFGPWHDDFVERWRRGTIARPGSDAPMARAAATKAPHQVEDLTKSEAYRSGDTLPVAAADVAGIRTALAVPMLKEGECIGVFSLSRRQVRAFTHNQIELVKNFAKQGVIAIQNAHLLNELKKRTTELSRSLDDLRAAQDRLVQTEKLASLGQLTAGIAHEIKNPLNFVNNFSMLSAELAGELNDLLKDATLTDEMGREVEELTQLLQDNLEKVVQHGKRADSIIKNMLLHSRDGTGEQRLTDINALVEESLNLAYHGARAEKSDFNIMLQRDFDATAGSIEVFPQEITRALLNLLSNGFYAATKRLNEGSEGFEPTLLAATKNLGSTVEIRIRDNGTGIPYELKEKVFNPFFTTKPPGEGTGLGLSMSHDIVVKQHGGRIEIETEPGAYTEFIISLPRKKPAQ